MHAPLPRLAVDARCAHGEGVVWCVRRQAVLWVDIDGARLWLHRPGDGHTRSWTLPDRPGCIGLVEDGSLLLALAKGLYRADLEAGLSGEELPLRRLAPVEPENPHTRSNDGRADRHGNFVFGTMNEHPEHAPTGAFYQFSFRHGLRRLSLPGAAIPNSICFSADGRTLYYCDSVRAEILCGDYDPETAQVSRARVFVRIEDHAGASPDGSALDAQGCVWNAQWGASRVVRYRPDGTPERVVPLPVPQPSCCAIGGPGLDTLYVITSPQGLAAEARTAFPTSGGLYAVPLEAALGLEESRVAAP
ncbi:sugar lactone lactonase YvrE [Pseudoxanthomonas broegbernensis]|nr:sugar lactone lactonase YvrE [Pseudoxanthomonas broegbernensis]